MRKMLLIIIPAGLILAIVLYLTLKPETPPMVTINGKTWNVDSNDWNLQIFGRK